MPRFSSFTCYGLLRFSRKPSVAEDVYRAIIASQREAFDVSVGTNVEAEAYATAMALGRARAVQERAANQYDPDRAFDMLPALERSFGVVPSETDAIRDRQRAVAARKLLPRGATREYVEASLSALLGDAYVTFRVLTASEASQWPAAPQNGPGVFARNDLPARTFRLSDSVSSSSATSPYTATFRYERPGGDDGSRLLVGDVVCVHGENLALAEKVTITDVDGSEYATADFTNPHDAGASLVAGPIPIWISQKRQVFVVVTDDAAVDAETRRKVNELMARMMRAVTTWAVVKRSSATTIGPFTVGESPLGAVPIGTLTIP